MFGDSKDAAYQYADAFVLPSFSEGLPMVILEAWSRKLPIVMKPECNLSEGFESAAIKVSTNPESVKEGLLRLFSMTDNDRVEMGGRGQSLVQQKFTWQKITADMKAVYDWIINSGVIPHCVRLD